jgi:protein-disulfide isomerase
VANGSSVSSLDRWALNIVVLCAIVVTGFVVRQQLFSSAEAGAPRPKKQQNWKELDVGNMQDGPFDAPVVVIVFSDFQCPYCKTLSRSIVDLERSYPAAVRLVFRNAPIPQLHEHAIISAVGAECSARQGSFRKFHDTLFGAQDSIGLIPWGEIATRAGIADTSRFLRCLAEDDPRESLRQDSIAGAKFGVASTPTVIVNGWRFSGTPSFSQIEDYLPKNVRRKKA